MFAAFALSLLIATCKPNAETEASPEHTPEQRSPAEAAYDAGNFPRYWNDLARYLAGLPPEPGSVLSKMDASKAALKHRSFFNRSWKSESVRLAAMAKWRKYELKDVAHLKRTVFYPFSGPDFINIYTFFPGSSRYILFGLEKPGTPPDVTDLSPGQQRAFLAHVQKSLSSILRWSFFRTLSMRVDFNNKSLNGLNPVLLAFIARTNNRVLDLTTVRIAPDGKLYAIYSDNAHPPKLRDLPVYSSRRVPSGTSFKSIPGVRIRFVKQGGSEIQELLFFSFDVSNSGLTSYGQFENFIQSHCPCTSYLKAASYLMYRDSFSRIRDLLLSQSPFLLQDDSGIPLRFFSREKWDLTFYGVYTKPIRLFRVRYQPDLRKVYTNQKIRPLPFGIGYKYAKGSSNLMAARRKN